MHSGEAVYLKTGRIFRRFAASAVGVVTALSALSAPMKAAADEIGYTASEAVISQMKSDYYSFDMTSAEPVSFGEYYSLYSGENRPDCEIEIVGGDYISADGSFSAGEYTADGITYDNALIWTDDGGRVVYEADIPESGIYCLEMMYCPLLTGSSPIEISMEIDGEIPYGTASRLTLGRVWENEGEIGTDGRGNQVRPVQVQREMWLSRSIGDSDGLFAEPLFFWFEKGRHEISFSAERSQFMLGSFRFYNPEEIPTYSEYSAEAEAAVTVEETPSRKFRIEGEAAAYKSDRNLAPSYDNTSYLVSPSDPRKIVYNTIGGDSWKKALTTVTWTIPKETIGNNGWYRIGIKARQNQMRGFYSTRRIYIDGEVLCSELDSVKFPYDKDWRMTSPETADGESIYVYLTADTDHTLTMEAVTGEIGQHLRSLEEIVAELNVYYRRILMITGPTPDKYTDYYVHERIPELIEEFQRISDELEDVQAAIEELGGTKGSEAAVIGQLAVVLEKCIDKPLRIPSYLSRIKEGISSLSAWTREYRDQPLEIDFIEFASADEEFASCKRKLGKSVKFGLSAFIGSFFEDYTAIGGSSDKEAIEIWVSLGRDQAQIVRELAESRFTAEYGIPVTVKLVSGGVVEAALAGEEPDAALFLGGEFPVNLAARGLLTDVSGMGEFDEVRARFAENAMTHYSYGGGVYGVPISQSFPMMFCRSDILSELGYDHPPETWDELRDMLPAIQRNYMSVGLVLPPANISPATEAGHTYAMLLLQNGLSYYNSDMTASALDETSAVQAFEQWTDFYSEYGFAQSYDAFSRFRTGEYPIVISNYTFANQLEAAAPEIKGLWEFCPVPASVRADGSLSHAANSTGSGAVIFESSDSKEEAWEFVKWFTSAEIQGQFGIRSEGILGKLGRFDTANLEALGQLSWSADELERLRAQQSELAEIPVTPASYAVTRNIMNAFREVLNEGENPRDTLLKYNMDINEEIKRKLGKMSKN